MVESKEIKDCIKEIYNILDKKPDNYESVKKASLVIVVIGAIKIFFTKLILIFS